MFKMRPIWYCKVESSKKKSDNTKKNFDYTTIADRFRTVSWGDDSHSTGVVKPVYGIPTFPLTTKAVDTHLKICEYPPHKTHKTTQLQFAYILQRTILMLLFWANRNEINTNWKFSNIFLLYKYLIKMKLQYLTYKPKISNFWFPNIRIWIFLIFTSGIPFVSDKFRLIT